MVYRPDDVLRKGEDLFDESHEFCLVVFDLAGEKLNSRGVQHVRPVGDSFPASMPTHEPPVGPSFIATPVLLAYTGPRRTPPTAPYS